MMTDTEVTRRILGASHGRGITGSGVGGDVADAIIEQIGLPTWTEEDETFARAVQRAPEGAEVRLRKEDRTDLHQSVQSWHR